MAGQQVLITYSISTAFQKLKEQMAIQTQPKIVPTACRLHFLRTVEPLLSLTDTFVTFDCGHRFPCNIYIANFRCSTVLSHSAGSGLVDQIDDDADDSNNSVIKMAATQTRNTLSIIPNPNAATKPDSCQNTREQGLNLHLIQTHTG